MVLQNVSKHLSCNHAVLISQNFSESGYFSVKMCRGGGTGDAGSAIAPQTFPQFSENSLFGYIKDRCANARNYLGNHC